MAARVGSNQQLHRQRSNRGLVHAFVEAAKWVSYFLSTLATARAEIRKVAGGRYDVYGD